MRLSPKQVIFIAVSNYLTEEESLKLLNEIASDDKMRDNTFLKIVGKYFDFTLLYKEPKIPEDIILFNYLILETKPSKNIDPDNRKQQISIRGKLPRSGGIVRYENRITIPQLKLMESVYKQLNKID